MVKLSIINLTYTSLHNRASDIVSMPKTPNTVNGVALLSE